MTESSREQEILTTLMIVVFGRFIAIVGITMYFVFTNPGIIQTLTVTGSVDLGVFVETFRELSDVLLVLFGVGIGLKEGGKPQ